MGQEPLKEVPKLKKWPDVSGEREYDNMQFIRGIEIIKEEFELPEGLVTAIFKNLLKKSVHRWYIKLRQVYENQSWNWLKIQIINNWANDAWGFDV
ncbi:hypothetical protein O181_034147 [Austropuccinia psidii MF-1]|uniref:Uncharacterized protein n=1 Tax=Austropuccinia psidii MF-1 TaxID=1389203 RepID=A0A9Q3D615_9BASI|nr:hypothetical protein [Austropuccinia psidii MF-1]